MYDSLRLAAQQGWTSDSRSASLKVSKKSSAPSIRSVDLRLVLRRCPAARCIVNDTNSYYFAQVYLIMYSLFVIGRLCVWKIRFGTDASERNWISFALSAPKQLLSRGSSSAHAGVRSTLTNDGRPALTGAVADLRSHLWRGGKSKLCTVCDKK